MIVGPDRLRTVREKHENSVLALRFGCYDIVHSEHQEGINLAKDRADVLVVGIMSDTYVSDEKGPSRPINNQIDRATVIDEAPGVDFAFVVPPGILSIVSILHNLRPDLYIEGDEHGRSKLKAIFLRLIGAEYSIDQRPKLYTTTQMIGELGLAKAKDVSSLSFTPTS